MNINQLNDAWIAKGQEVSDLNNKLNTAVLDDNFSKDEFAKLKEQRDNAKAQRDALKDQLDETRAQEVKAMKPEDKKPLNKKELDIKNQFVKDFKNMVTSGKAGAGNGGLTIPDDI